MKRIIFKKWGKMQKNMTVPAGFPKHLITQIYYLFIMTSDNGTFYTGITSDIGRRIYQIKNCAIPGLPGYNQVNKLVYVEQYNDIRSAIWREFEIKAFSTEEMAELVRTQNPDMIDISYQFVENSALV